MSSPTGETTPAERNLKILRLMLERRLVSSKDRETVEKCWPEIAEAAANYDPSERPSRLATHEIEAELRMCAKSIHEALKTVQMLSSESLWEIDASMLPKMELYFPKWGKERRLLLKSWFEEDEWKFHELWLVAKSLNKLANMVAREKATPNGRRRNLGPKTGPVEVLLFSIASSVHSQGRPLVHAKRIGDVVHQWATAGSEDIELSDRAWRKIEAQFSRRGHASKGFHGAQEA